MSEPRLVQAWELWANPIFRRYCRSRLRQKHLVPWALIVLIVTLFMVFLLYTVSQRSGQYDWEDGARIALVPLVILQMLLLMFLGTGAVAAGIARESIDGMIDYQRLTPLSPLAKIVGYLFGLPVREYVLTLITLPFVLYCAYRGGIPFEAGLKFYSVFATAVVLYHLTALVAGSVVKKKFLAGRISQFLVVLLYLVLPRFAALGFIFLVHLTVLPAWSEQALPYLENFGVARVLSGFGAEVPWFKWDFSPTTFSLLVQLAVIGVFTVVLARKWRDPDCHTIGHGFAVVVYGALLALILGNALPLIADGSFFQGARQMMDLSSSDTERRVFGWVVMTLVGLSFFAGVLLCIHLIVPTRHEALRGFRRAAKLQRARVSPFSDDSSSLGFALLLILFGWCAWSWFSNGILDSSPFEDVGVARGIGLITQGLAFCLPLLAFQLLLETRGWRSGLLWALFLWVVPPLVGIIMVATGRLEALGTYTASLSGPVLVVYTMVRAAMGVHAPDRDSLPVEEALWIGLAFYALALPYLAAQWRRYRKRLLDSVG